MQLLKFADGVAPAHEGADEPRVRNRTGLLLFGIFVLVTNFSGESVTTIRKTVTEVGFTLVATDRSGKSLPTLSTADIEVLENGQPVPNFELRAAENNPLRLGIMLDLSDSTRKAWPQTENAVKAFLQQVMGPQDEMLLVAFDSRLETERTLTEPLQASALIPTLRGGGPTALYDAVYTVCQNAAFNSEGGPRRSAVILFSDGVDNLSIHDLEQAIGSAQARGISIYTISAHSRRVQNPGDRVLRHLAETTGGRDFVVAQDRDLHAALVSISSELRSYYLLYYRPPNESGTREFRHVRVVPTQNWGPVLRYKDGYYTAPAQGNDH